MLETSLTADGRYRFWRRFLIGACMLVGRRCYLKLGDWQENLEGINESSIPQVLQYYTTATYHNKNWYKVGGSPLPVTAHVTSQQELVHGGWVGVRFP